MECPHDYLKCVCLSLCLSLALSLLSAASQLTVGAWFRLYSLAFSRRLAMLLAMFIPWDVLVLEQVGVYVAMALRDTRGEG